MQRRQEWEGKQTAGRPPGDFEFILKTGDSS